MKREAIIHAYPWTLTDIGLDKALDEIEEAGLTGICVTPHYHIANYFMPTNPRRKFYFGEAGRAYFVPDESRYQGRTIMRPHVSAIVEGERYFHQIAEKVRARGLELHFWTVYFYSHERARDYPQCAKVDALGHVHPSDGNPMNPHARGYALALTEDLVANYEPDGVHLESLSFHGYGHGMGSGMKGFTEFRPRDRFLLGLDFSQDSIAEASRRGVDAETLHRAVREYLERAITEPTNEGDTEPVTESWLAEAFDARLMPYLLAQQEMVSSLFEEVVALAKRVSKHPLKFSITTPSESGRWETGVVPSRILPLVQQVHQVPPEVSSPRGQVSEMKKGLPPACKMLGRIGWGQLVDPGAIIPAMEDFIQGGGDGFTFLTYGLLRPSQWETIRRARHLWT